MSEHENQEVLLKVEHLCQYFKMGDSELKAVDDVNFDIKRGEVFGLVGESGCGKTTTGRSIIKIYDITSGSIYFKGQRICAGTRSYRDAIASARKELRKLGPNDTARKAELEKVIESNREEIRLRARRTRSKIPAQTNPAAADASHQNPSRSTHRLFT